MIVLFSFLFFSLFSSFLFFSFLFFSTLGSLFHQIVTGLEVLDAFVDNLSSFFLTRLWDFWFQLLGFWLRILAKTCRNVKLEITRLY